MKSNIKGQSVERIQLRSLLKKYFPVELLIKLDEISCAYDNRYGMITKFLCTNVNCQKNSMSCSCYSKIYNNALCGFQGNYVIINL